MTEQAFFKDHALCLDGFIPSVFLLLTSTLWWQPQTFYSKLTLYHHT